jgi:hypothetical protein
MRGQASSNLLYGNRRTFKRKEPKQVFLEPEKDEDYLRAYDRAKETVSYSGNWTKPNKLKIVADSDLFVAPPTNKEYRGHIALGMDDQGQVQFIGCTAYGAANKCGSLGKVYYVGSNLDQAIHAVNEVLNKKRYPSGSKAGYHSLANNHTNLDRQWVIHSMKKAIS